MLTMPTWVAARNASRSARDITSDDMRDPPQAVYRVRRGEGKVACGASRRSFLVSRLMRASGLGRERDTRDERGRAAFPFRRLFVWGSVMSGEATVVVIGGGIVGLSTAMALAQGT